MKRYTTTLHSRNVSASTPRISRKDKTLKKLFILAIMAISDFQDFFLKGFQLGATDEISQDHHFETPLPRAMKALRQKLQRHQITRQWVGLDSDKQAVPHDEQELLGDSVLLPSF